MPAYVAIYTTTEELEWPDYLDVETGVFRYYGDNRKPGKELHDTPKGGNQLLKNVFQWLNELGNSLENIPPFLIFQKAGEGRDVRFCGLAAPGNPNIPNDRDLLAFWRTMNQQRFQNYEAYFTILDTRDETISKNWLKELIYNHDTSLAKAPSCWKKFAGKGRSGIKPLMAPRITKIPTKSEQIPIRKEDVQLLNEIKKYYDPNPYAFEKCAVEITKMMDSNFCDFIVTRPWRDGGRDAIGKYRIGNADFPLYIDCALEAKCYDMKTAVGVKPMSRLISRIKYRHFGIMVTTSYVHEQAYKEIIEDGHQILIINAKNITDILRQNGINLESVMEWMKGLED